MSRDEKKEKQMDYKDIMSYNMRIIQALWKSIKGGYGRNMIKGNEQDTESLYASIEKSRQSIRDIKNKELIKYDKEKIKKWAEHIENKTGIPHEYLEGREHIRLSPDFENNIYHKYTKYIECCEHIDKHVEIAEQNPIGCSETKLKKMLENIIDKNKEDAQKLNGQEREKRNAENKKFEKEVFECESAVAYINQFNKELGKEIIKIKTTDNIYDVYNDEKLYRLVYFIKCGRKFSAVSNETFDDVIKIIQETKTKKLLDLGEARLSKYIEVMKKELELAEAVYTVAVDVGKFKKK